MRPEHDMMRRLLRARMDRRASRLRPPTMGALAMGAGRWPGHSHRPRTGGHAQHRDLAALSRPGDARRVQCGHGGGGSTSGLRLHRGDGGAHPRRQQRHRHRGPQPYAARAGRRRLLEPWTTAGCPTWTCRRGSPVRRPGLRPPATPTPSPRTGAPRYRLLGGRGRPGAHELADFFRMAARTPTTGGSDRGHQISSMGSAAVAMGYDLNTVDETELNAWRHLIALQPRLFAINSDVEPPLRNRDSLATIAWTGNGVAVVRDNPDTAPVHRRQRRRRAVGRLVGHRRRRTSQGCGVRVPRLHPPAREQCGRHRVLAVPACQPGGAAAAAARGVGQHRHLPACGAAPDPHHLERRGVQQPAPLGYVGAHQVILSFTGSPLGDAGGMGAIRRA